MLTRHQIGAIRASLADARAEQERAMSAWRRHQDVVAAVYDAGQDDDDRTTEEAMGDALGVTRQQVWAWRKASRARIVAEPNPLDV